MDMGVIAQPLVKALEARGGATVEAMRNDANMRAAARIALEATPSPIRVAIKMTVGEAGFEAFVLRLRDQMLHELGSEAGRAAGRNLAMLVTNAIANVSAAAPGAAAAAIAPGSLTAVSVVWEAKPPRQGGLKEVPAGRNAVIGRDASCDIVLADGSVSRRHAEIQVTANGVAIRDLQSTNGTILAGQRIAAVHWPAGQKVVIGEFTLTYGAATPVLDPAFLRLLTGAR